MNWVAEREIELINVTHSFNISWLLDVEPAMIWYISQIIGGGMILYTIMSR